MTERRPTPRLSRIGTGGAVVVASLIFVALIVALVAGFVAVRTLNAAAAESRLLYDVQERLDALVRLQLDEETALRGYLIAHQREFLEPYLSSALDPFEQSYQQLDADLRQTD